MDDYTGWTLNGPWVSPLRTWRRMSRPTNGRMVSSRDLVRVHVYLYTPTYGVVTRRQSPARCTPEFPYLRSKVSTYSVDTRTRTPQQASRRHRAGIAPLLGTCNMQVMLSPPQPAPSTRNDRLRTNPATNPATVGFSPFWNPPPVVSPAAPLLRRRARVRCDVTCRKGAGRGPSRARAGRQLVESELVRLSVPTYTGYPYTHTARSTPYLMPNRNTARHALPPPRRVRRVHACHIHPSIHPIPLSLTPSIPYHSLTPQTTRAPATRHTTPLPGRVGRPSSCLLHSTRPSCRAVPAVRRGTAGWLRLPLPCACCRRRRVSRARMS